MSHSAPALSKQTSLSLSDRLALGSSGSHVIASLADLDLGPRGKQDSGILDDPIEENERLSAELQELAHKLEKECFFIIFKILPQKVARLDAMYRHDPRFLKSSSEVKKAGPIPTLDGANGTPKLADARKDSAVPCNGAIVALADALKDEMLALSQYMSSLSTWIQLNVPRMSDNTAFSQEVQAELLDQIKASETVGMEVLDQFAAYYLTRAELVTKCIKYPQIDDYRRAIEELDDKTFIKIATVAADVRTLYLMLFDLLTKNLTTLLDAVRMEGNPESNKMFV